MSNAQDIITALSMQPHPEGGWYKETWREGEGRGLASGILYLIEEGQRSHWHRIDAAEMWIYNAGSPLTLSIASGDDGETVVPDVILGPDVVAGQQIQHVYRPGEWQAAHAAAGWTLVSCIVSPGFRFEGFELAAPDWVPAASR
ncbi:cupin domain-containing protein [Croceicoccus mobilis]|uniref:Cupin n=1 Tax=Croceicoccus mobilis TaxID=1703339 RepID=A0A917DXD9_9SPHN|nr:cupin domain-containing protein [Croceicoccus mobilis]GGD76692.1 cupin [Croceicoccus mobilis]